MAVGSRSVSKCCLGGGVDEFLEETALPFKIAWAPLCHSIFIHSSTDGQLGCFQILAIVNNTVMDIGAPIFFLIGISGFIGYIPRNRITGSNSSFILKFLRKLHTVFHSGCTSMHSQ